MSWLLQDVWARIEETATIHEDANQYIRMAVFKEEQDARACIRHAFDGGIFFNALCDKDVELKQDEQDARIVHFHWKRR
jgi:hypothetical protein